MARTSNFSISLRSRKPSDKPVPSFNIPYTRDSLVNMEQFFARSAKAEKLLGPLELLNDGSSNKGLNGPRSPKLQKKKTRYGQATTKCTLDKGHERERDRDRPRTQASSLVLGCAQCDRSMASGTDSFLHKSGSCSTLRSHYDPTVSPLLVSQQTSASSSRDMALRKGCPVISCAPPYHILSTSHLDKVNQMDNSASLQIGARRRPPKLDLSSLFHKPRSLKGPLLSPEKVTRSPSNMSTVSEGQRMPTPTYRRRLSRRGDKLSCSPDSTHKLQEESPAVRRHVAVDPDSSKNRKLQAQKPMTDKQSNAMSSNEPQSSCVEAGRHPGTPTSQSSLRPSSSSSIRTLTSQLSLDIDLLSGSHAQQLTGHNAKEYVEILAGDVSNSCDHPMFYSDLHTQSILFLSSSEDESDGDLKTVKTDGYANLNGGKFPSIAQPRSSVYSNSSQQINNDAGSAKARSSSLPSSTKDRTSNALLKRFREVEFDSGSKQLTPGMKDLGGVQRKELSSAKSSMHQQAGSSRRMNRYMAVTRDEEKLLEAMREKRANMRHTIFVDGNSDLAGRWTQNDSLPRPRTADASKRSSKYLRADMSNFPAPPLATKNVNCSHGTASDEDISKLQGFRSIDDWPLPALRHSFLSMSKGSSESSHGSFDALPSPMTSHSSPLTPPPDQLASDFSNIGLATSPGQVSYKMETKFPRRGVQSNDTLMFNFFGQAQEEQEENDLIQWADQIYSS